MTKWFAILKLVSTVALAFNLNEQQEKDLAYYAKQHEATWAETPESEIKIALIEESQKIIN